MKNTTNRIPGVQMRRRRFLVVLPLMMALAAVALLLALNARTRPVRADTLCVKPGGGDGCEATITAALALANAGDTIQVAAGTYQEYVLISQTLTLQGGWAPDFSMRDLSQFTSTIRPPITMVKSDSVVSIRGQFADTGLVTPTLDGFTITGGRADLGSNHGGGIKITNSDAVVISNTIRGNRAFFLGGGIWVQNGAPHIEGNRIQDNLSDGLGQQAYGGGVQLEGAQATLVDNLIVNNIVSGTQGFGGGIDIIGGGLVSLRGNAIISNATKSLAGAGIGGGISSRQVALTLAGDVISANLALGIGGGLNVTGNLTATSATIAYNRSTRDGGGIHFDGVSGNLLISNTLLTANEAGSDGGGVYFVSVAPTGLRRSGLVAEGAAKRGAASAGFGNLWVSGSRVFSNSAGVSGGGFFQTSGLFSITNSILEGNQAASGGAIEAVLGRLVISNTALIRNQAGDGGALYVGTDQISLIHDSVISANTALFNAGGVLNLAAMTVTQSLIQNNGAGDSAGAIENHGPLLLAGSRMAGNAAGLNGGALLNLAGASTAIVNSAISENRADSDDDAMGDGGGIYNQGQLALDATALFSNSAASFGGGIFSDDALTITRSLIDRNRSDDGAGIQTEGADSVTTIFSSTVQGNVTALGGGAGINNNGQLSIWGSTFSGNRTLSANGNGGGILNNGEAEIANSTVSGNVAGGLAGGLRNAGTMMLTNVTVFSNTGGLGAGGVQNMDTAVLVNTILAANSPDNCGDPVISQGHNMEGEDSCSLAAVGDQPNTDPMLAGLAEQGGDVGTHALLPGSPAIDAGDGAACPSTDQRGVPRPIDGDGDGVAICDVGAVEFRTPTTTTILADGPDPSQAGGTFTVTFSVTAAVGLPTGVVTVTVSDDAGSCSGTLAGGLGGCSLTLSVPGTYTLTATYGSDGTFGPSSDTEKHTVTPPPAQPTTTTILADAPDPSQPGETFTVTFSVTATVGLPTGAVTVTVSDDLDSCSGMLLGGLGDCWLTLSVPGTYTLTAAYGGDGAYAPSGAAEAHTVTESGVHLYLPVVLRN